MVMRDNIITTNSRYSINGRCVADTKSTKNTLDFQKKKSGLMLENRS